jgi:hypothetical protein
MERQQYYELPRFAPILSVIDAIFSEINVGLLVYHVERKDEIRTARLIYANREASRVTGTDLGRRIGMLIVEAFPALEGTPVLDRFAEVVREQESRRVVVEYGDANVRRARYVTRAFPMPDDCFGVVFDEESSATGTAGG